MRLSTLLPFALLTITGCTTVDNGTESPPTSSVSSDLLSNTCNSNGYQPVEWVRGSTYPFPYGATHLENIQVRWDDSSFYAWGIADGVTVTYLYHVYYRDQPAFNAEMIDAMPTQQGVGNSKSWGVQGVGGTCCVIGPNPPIGPGGFPMSYVRRLGTSAGGITDHAVYMGQVLDQLAHEQKL